MWQGAGRAGKGACGEPRNVIRGVPDTRALCHKLPSQLDVRRFRAVPLETVFRVYLISSLEDASEFSSQGYSC